MVHIKIFLLKILLRILGLIHRVKFQHSQNYEGNFKYMNWEEKLWWGYKALIRQVEKAEPGKKIEPYFAAQNLNFEPKAGFNPVSRLTLTAGGDLSTSEVIYPESTGQLWDDVADFYFSGDIVCANLESPLDPSKPVVGLPSVCLTAPDLNTSPEMFQRFIRGGRGINFFATANNHDLDQGESGLIATLDFLDTQGYPHVGTARTAAEQMAFPIIEKNGIRVAMLSYTFSLNRFDSIPGKEYLTNHIRLNKPDSDIGLIRRHIQTAREQKADLIVAVLHWSIEFETYPVANVINMGHRIIESGVDIILGGHPHVAQPMEKYSFREPATGEIKDGFIAYSLGELLSYNAFSKNSRLALLIRLEIAKAAAGNHQTKITSLNVLPIYTWIRRLPDELHDYRLLDFRKMMHRLQNGENPHGFKTREIKELKRLETLLYRKILPSNTSSLFVK